MSSSGKNKNLAEIEYSLKRRLDYEHATVECMRTLLEPGSTEDILPRVLDIVHKVVDNSRTYIFKNEIDPELGLCMSQIYEAVSNGIAPQIDNPDLQHLSYKEATPTLFPVLEARQHFAHLVEELDNPERTIFSEQGILSVLILPIFAGQDFWGFIGFDDCIENREWDENDVILLEMVADGIGEFISHRKAEDELKQSEALLNEVGTMAKIGGWEIDLISGKHRGTEEIASIHEIDMETMTDLEIYDGLSYYPPGSRERIEKAFNDLVEKAEPFELELEFITAKGNHKWVKTSAYPKMVNGKVVKVTGTMQDITTLKEAETKLRESEALLNEVGIMAKIGGWEYDVATETGKWTPEVYKIYELDPNSSTSVDFTLEFYLPDSRKIIEEAFYAAIEKAEPYDLELEFITEKGNHKWVRTIGKPVIEDHKVVKLTGTIQDITESKKVDEKLRESESRVRRKLTAIMEPGGDISELELADIIDKEALEPFMQNFYHLTSIPVGIIDLEGNILIATGWQDICTNFHRKNPQSCKHCIESDVELSHGVDSGKFKAYKCKNNMWDIVTPIIVGGSHIGNLFLGQFFLEDEEIPYDTFRLQAKEYGFNEKEYFEALERVPRWNRETIKETMEYYTRLIDVLTSMSYSNIKLARTLKERDELLTSLHDSEEKLKLFIEHAPASLAMFDRDMKYIAVSNRWFTEISHVGRDIIGDIIGKSHYEVFPEIPDEWKERHQRALEGEIIIMEETSLKHADGTLHWLYWEARPWKTSDGTIGGIVIFAEDITERKIAEERIQESEKKFRMYVENAPSAIIIADEHGNYLEVNKTACTLTGYDEDEFTHMNISDIIEPESLTRAKESLDELKTTGYTSTELQIRHKGGTAIWVRRDGTKLSDNRFLMSVTDITEKKKAEHSLIEAKILAEHNNRIKSEFLANMSHELRTPLTSVIGFSDILQEGLAGDLTEKQLGYVDNINKSGNHLLEIINDILDLSKVETGKMELECEDFQVSELIDETLESMSPISGKKNIKLILKNNANDVNIHADKVKLRQILYNLLSNAIKFTPENGEVFVSIERTANGIQVSVTDTGIGIPAEMQEEIFSPFTQVDASNKRRYGGTGLGLALVKKFVELHNGKVWLESEEEKGSTFTFTIEDQKKDD